MSDNGKEIKGDFVFEFDNKNDPKEFTLKIPLEKISNDETLNGLIYMIGIFEHGRSECVSIIRRKKIEMMKSRLVVPVSNKPINLEVN